MGVLNITPDSFYDGGFYKEESTILNQVEKMLEAKATFIDIGAYSSKPNADDISQEEELKRILPIIDLLLKYFPDIILSVDTFRSKVAKECVEKGAAIVNDISAGQLDDKMIKTVADLNVPYIMMHMKGSPQTMQQKTNYHNILKEILLYFSEKIANAKSLGIKDIIIDPGFGFAKSREQNFELLNILEGFKITNLPLLAGVSRKSMIYKTLNISAAQALNGTTALNMIALEKGAKILRVHDVKEAVECIKLHNQLHA